MNKLSHYAGTGTRDPIKSSPIPAFVSHPPLFSPPPKQLRRAMTKGTSNTSGGDYTYSGSGTNSQGNHYCSREGNDGGSGYHYSNTDGSYYYQNTNGSTYYNSGNGYAQYTSPDGNVSKSTGK